MRVRVDEPGSDRTAARVDDRRAGRERTDAPPFRFTADEHNRSGMSRDDGARPRAGITLRGAAAWRGPGTGQHFRGVVDQEVSSHSGTL
jgi:hypothetical protein